MLIRAEHNYKSWHKMERVRTPLTSIYDFQQHLWWYLCLAVVDYLSITKDHSALQLRESISFLIVASQCLIELNSPTILFQQPRFRKQFSHSLIRTLKRYLLKSYKSLTKPDRCEVNHTIKTLIWSNKSTKLNKKASTRLKGTRLSGLGWMEESEDPIAGGKRIYFTQK